MELSVNAFRVLIKFTLTISLIVAFNACSISPRGLDHNLDRFSDVPKDEKEKICKIIEKSKSDIKNFRGLYELNIDKDNKSEVFKQTIIFEYPDKFRLDLFSTNMNSLSVLVAAESGMIKGVDLVAKEGFIGTVSKENNQRLLLIPLELSQLMLLFPGRLEVNCNNSTLDIRKDFMGEYLVSANFSDNTRFRALYIKADNEDNLQLRRLEIYNSDKIELRADYGYLENKENNLPEKIVLKLNNEDLLATFHKKEIIINSDISRISSRVFKVSFPDNIRIHELD